MRRMGTKGLRGLGDSKAKAGPSLRLKNAYGQDDGRWWELKERGRERVF
jgi:hypothetical protein